MLDGIKVTYYYQNGRGAHVEFFDGKLKYEGRIWRSTLMCSGTLHYHLYLRTPIRNYIGMLHFGDSFFISPKACLGCKHQLNMLRIGLDSEVYASRISPRIFYKNVDDYIQGTVSNNIATR